MVNLPRLRCLSLLKQGGLVMNQLKQIHAQVILNGSNCPESASTTGKLVEGYFSIPTTTTDGIDNARLIFEHNGEPDAFIWNVMIRCLPPQEAIQLFANGSSLSGLVFDRFTYIYVLGACARSRRATTLLEGKQIHTHIVKTGFGFDFMVQTTAVHFYASQEDCISARQLFNEMPYKTSATWSAMISGYCSQKKLVEHHANEALMLFCEMLHDNYVVTPTERTMVSVLSACSRIGDLLTGSCVHGRIEKTFPTPDVDVYIGTCLVDMYSKCGSLSSALSVFNRMKMKDILTWTSLITGLARHGQAKQALEILDTMHATNIRPNAVTFTSLLFACCQAGLVEEGLVLFLSMSSKFGVTPDIQHYGCIIDLLGRTGRLEEAYNFMMEMPLQPDAISWRSLLGACKIHGDVMMGEKVGKHLLRLRQGKETIQPTSTCQDFIALSNMYASSERWVELETVRELMKDEGIRVDPGCSSVQLL